MLAEPEPCYKLNSAITMFFTVKDIQKRREKLGSKWNEILRDDEAVLIYSGEPVPKPGGLDQHYPFIPHPAYYWLTARRREDEIVLYNKNTGWVEFQKEFTIEQAIWEAEKDDLLVSEPGLNINHLKDYLEKQKFSSVYNLGQTSDIIVGKAFELRTMLDQTRRKKDEAEIKLIKHIAEIAAFGYKEIERILKPGMSEREIQIAYESVIFRHGSHTIPYDTIIGCGTNAAILHALPTRKIIREQEFVLVDAGADVFDYCVDVTRTFPSTANISSQHKDLYQLVLKTELECIEMTKADTFWRDVHAKAAIMLTEGLYDLGILRGNMQRLIEKEVISVFFPHGLGHLVGLRVRDTGQEENLEPKHYFGSRLRVDIQLEQGHLITVEPGIYFMQALLDSPDVQKKFKEEIDWLELEKWKHIGGVRIEDNVLVTEAGNENLTLCVPKSAEL